MPARRRKRRYHTGHIRQRGHRWQILWRVNGRQLAETHATRALAEKALLAKLTDIAHGRAGSTPPRERKTLGVLAAAWLESRRAAGQHRSIDDDEGRWTNHLKPDLGHLTPDEVTPSVLRRLIEKKLTSGRLRERGLAKERKKPGDKGLSPSTVRLLVAQLSTMYSDLKEDGHATGNPARDLPKKIRRLIRPAHDPRTTPFVEKAADIRRVYLKLAEPINVAYALGSMAGLRTGEVRALAWAHVDIERGRIHVRASADGPLKDDESRIVPLQAALIPVLKAWRLKTGGRGLVVPPVRRRSKSTMVDGQSLGRALRAALTALELPRLTWYQATRHSFASQWVLAGGSIEKLQVVMGHSTVLVTQRYAHLRPDLFEDRDSMLLAIDLATPEGDVASIGKRQTP